MEEWFGEDDDSKFISPILYHIVPKFFIINILFFA